VSVSVPQFPQVDARVALGAQTPWPVQAPADHWQAAVQVSISVPQFPQLTVRWVFGVQAPGAPQVLGTFWQVIVVVKQVSVVLGSRSSQHSAVESAVQATAQGMAEQVGKAPSYVLSTSSGPGPSGGRSLMVNRPMTS
jgi:hypothetical protein